jgi:GNAT superfamily N-acetyltransferase
MLLSMGTAEQTAKSKDDTTITVRPLEPNDWPIIEKHFGDNGACGGCWCMWPRVPRGGKLWEESKGEKNRASFRRLVKAGKVHAVLAFCGEEPIGWCSFGPRETFPRLETVRALKRDWSADTWSIVCFYIPARWRGRGVASRLLGEATTQAFALGAREIEGYPVVPKNPPERIPAAFAWTGVPALFEQAEYEELHRPEMSRPLYLKANREEASR